MYEQEEPDAGLLKTIVPMMTRHAAGYHPISYAVWYEYARGSRPALCQSIDAALKGQARLTPALTYSLYSSHIVEPAEQVIMNARSGLLELVEQVKYAVHQTDEDTVRFDARLNEFKRDLAAATTVEDLGSQVSSMLAEIQRASSGFGTLSIHLDQTKGEVQRLTDELHRLREDALTDALSGLLNRRGFDSELRRLAPRQGSNDEALALIMFDIDNFKKINDSYGHQLGDQVIAAVGRTIRECLGQAGVAARYGGEEFAVLLTAQPIATVENMAQAIRKRIELGKITRRDGQEPIGGVTVSAGIASWSPGGDSYALVERADQALYASKRAGRNRVTVQTRQ